MTDTQKTHPQTVIYEVNLTVPKARQQELLSWLTPHISEMLALPGFIGAHTLQHESDEQSTDSFQCTVHYYLDNQQSMQHYFERFAEQMRASGRQRFKQDLQATRRVLRSHKMLNIALPSLPVKNNYNEKNVETPATCMDCASSLHGGFCHACGQRDQRRLVSVFSLVAEFFDGVFNWDSRFWRTMKPLLFRPGHLTEAYLNGQRERYIPPVRMYLITSVVFFLLIALVPQQALQGDGALTLNDLSVELGDSEGVPDTTDDFAIDMHIGLDDNENQLIGAPTTATSSPAKNSPSEDEGIAPEQRNLQEFCKEILNEEKTQINPESLRQPLYRICNSLTTRSGARAFIREFFNNLPKTLFVLLPLMALISKLFYPLSKRYYVEHLLYYVHNYSFLFLFSSLLLLISAALKRFDIAWPEWISIVALLYVMYYFMKSMRVVYRQSRRATALKWTGIMLVFGLLSSLFMIGLIIGTAALTA